MNVASPVSSLRNLDNLFLLELFRAVKQFGLHHFFKQILPIRTVERSQAPCILVGVKLQKRDLSGPFHICQSRLFEVLVKKFRGWHRKVRVVIELNDPITIIPSLYPLVRLVSHINLVTPVTPNVCEPQA